jgi:hypothetical protein
VEPLEGFMAISFLCRKIRKMANENPSLSATQSGMQRNSAAFPWKIAGNRRNSATLAPKPDQRKCPAERRRISSKRSARS